MPAVTEVQKTENSRTTTEVLTVDGAVAGDTLIVLYGSDYYALATMPDATSTAGDLELIDTADMGDSSGHIKAYRCVVESTGEHTVTIPAHIDCDIHGHVLLIPGTMTVDDHDVLFTTSTVNPHDAPSVDAAADDRLLVCVWLTPTGPAMDGDDYTVPGSMTEHAETQASPFSAMCTASEPVDAGATGTRSATWIALGKYAAISLVLGTTGQTVDIGQALELDTAAAIDPVRLLSTSQALQLDEALPITPVRTAAIGQASQADEALPVTPVRVVHVGQALELDSALVLTADGPAPAVSRGRLTSGTRTGPAMTTPPRRTPTIKQGG